MMQEKQILAEVRITAIHRMAKLTRVRNKKKKKRMQLQVGELYLNVYPHCFSLASILKKNELQILILLASCFFCDTNS